jgi:ABC-type amino acid transport substrate-binding protein
VLAPTARGRTIRDLYDNGIRTLHDQGALEAIYAKWGHAVPDFGKFR